MGLILKVEFISKNCEFDHLNSQVQIWQWPPTQIMVMNVILSQQLSKKWYNSSLWLMSNGTRDYDVDGYKLNVWTKKEDFSGKRFLVEPGFWGSNTMTEFGSRANLVSLDVSLLHCISMFTRFAYLKITFVTTRIEYLRNKNATGFGCCCWSCWACTCWGLAGAEATSAYNSYQPSKPRSRTKHRNNQFLHPTASNQYNCTSSKLLPYELQTPILWFKDPDNPLCTVPNLNLKYRFKSYDTIFP